MSKTTELFKALADDVRLRMLRILGEAELSVAELVQVLGLPQSTVSRHLKPLRECGLAETRRDGTSVLYRRGAVFGDPAMAAAINAQLASMRGLEADKAVVESVLERRRSRSREFFEQVAGHYGQYTDPGGAWAALAASLASGFAGCRVVDVGAGEGALSLLLAPFARSVTALDASPRMLRVIEERAAAAGFPGRVHTVEGDMEDLPLPDGSADAVFLSQCLHHAARPGRAVQEAARVLDAGGRLIVLDLEKHQHEWVREQWADQWLGFQAAELEEWMRQAGLGAVVSRPIRGPADDLGILLSVAVKPNQTTA